MDAFGWSTQPTATVPSCPTDDALFVAFLGASGFEELHSAGAGDGTVRSEAYHSGLDLTSCHSDLSLLRCQDGPTLPGHGDASSNVFLDSVSCFLPAIAGTHDDGLHDRFAFVPDEPAQAAGSNTAFSGYSTTTGGGGGNVSSGESNTYGGGGHETEVASPACTVSRQAQQITQVAPPPTKRNKVPDKHLAPAASLTAAATVEAREWC